MSSQAERQGSQELGAAVRTEFVRVLLWDGDAEAAWVEANKGVNLPDEVWLSVAGAREETHPDDSIAVYRRITNSLVDRTSNGNYDVPVSVVRKMRDLLKKRGRDTDFEAEVLRLRLEFKRKRNFMHDLDAVVRGR
jgi:uncharacterized Zn finger protein